MLRETTSTLAASNGATVISFPEPDDDIIPVITGLPLVDCDAKVIARRIRSKPWAERARFFRNAVHDSFESVAKMIDYAKDRESGARFLDFGMVEMQRRIGEVLDLWGAEEPDCAAAAALFCLSLKPGHQSAGRNWTEKQGFASVLDFFAGDINKRYNQLGILYRMIWLANPSASILWEVGPLPWPEDWFDLPDDPKPAASA